jgi:tricorn protease
MFKESLLMVSNPIHFSNGQLIAFTGEYDGNMDVYVVSVDGGDPKG